SFCLSRLHPKLQPHVTERRSRPLLRCQGILVKPRVSESRAHLATQGAARARGGACALSSRRRRGFDSDVPAARSPGRVAGTGTGRRATCWYRSCRGRSRAPAHLPGGTQCEALSDGPDCPELLQLPAEGEDLLSVCDGALNGDTAPV